MFELSIFCLQNIKRLLRDYTDYMKVANPERYYPTEK